MNPIDKLVKIFSEFPGIGPKQARRFVYFLITRSTGFIKDFEKNIEELRADIVSCGECRRYFIKSGTQKLCPICSDEHRDKNILLVVSRDVDLENIEKSHGFAGTYFVLGGTVPILDKNPEQKIRLEDLLSQVSVKAAHGLSEIILGLDANAEGEYTADLVKNSLAPILAKHGIKISELGRGLSTGSELEYSDPDTIKYALKNRA